MLAWAYSARCSPIGRFPKHLIAARKSDRRPKRAGGSWAIDMRRRKTAKYDVDLAAFFAVRETEAFLEHALRHPDVVVRIPVIRVGFGSFPPRLANEFWARTLDLHAA
jgi:hypothetical protein